MGILLYEWAGIPGMLVSGYLSDRVFRGRRAPATICFMLFVILAILVYWFNPAGNILIDNLALIAIGFPHLRSSYDDWPSSGRDMVPRVATGGATGLTRSTWLPHRFRWCWCVHGSSWLTFYGWDGGFVALCWCMYPRYRIPTSHTWRQIPRKE